MKRAILVLLIATTAAAAERSEKRALVSEVLEVLDAKAQMRASFENFVGLMSSSFGDEHSAADIPEEYRAQFEAQQKKEQEKMRVFKERLYAHIDYDKYFDEAYVPVLEDRFTEDELRTLLAFLRTKPGQKFAGVLPHLGITARGWQLIDEAAKKAQEEIAAEEKRKNPWRETLQDMRAIATAVEARATDTNDYPNVSFDQLEELIVPTYLRTMPKNDVWGTPFLYIGDGEHYRIVSAGADRHFEWSSKAMNLDVSEGLRTTYDPNEDIIFQDGNFLQSPAEIAQPN